jgi:hypothetical protein
MKHITPNTPEAGSSIIESVIKCPKIYKADLVTHAARCEIARKAGFLSWESYKAHKNSESEIFMESLVNGGQK